MLGGDDSPRTSQLPTEVIRSRFDDKGGDGHTQRIEGAFWIQSTDLASKAFKNAAALLWFNDTVENGCIPTKEEWAGLLRLVNIMQFMPGFHAVSKVGLASGWCPGALDALLAGPSLMPETEAGSDPAWDELFELTDRAVHELLKKLADHHAPTPESGYELLGPSGTIVAAAELAWEAMRLAVILDTNTPDTKAFTEQGWTVFSSATPEDREAIITRITSLTS